MTAALWVALVVAALGVVGAGGVAVAFMQRRLTAANAAKSNAEARTETVQADLVRAQARKEAAEAESTQVATMRSIVAEVREQIAEDKERRAELRMDIVSQAAHHKETLRDIRARLDAVEESNADLLADNADLRIELQETRVLLAAHGQWDLLVVAEVRIARPDFPDPPPLTRLDPEFHP